MCEEDDILVDEGNSFYRDDIRRGETLQPLGIRYADAGVSGGAWGFKEGYCLMVGGDEQVYRHLSPLLESLTPREGYLYCGPTGRDNFVKMVHNGIEYGMMAAYGEGFAILKASPYGRVSNFKSIAHLWNQGSVVRSWLLELAELAFEKDPELLHIEGYVEDSGGADGRSSRPLIVPYRRRS